MNMPGPKDYPRCEKCGHESQYHGMTFCKYDWRRACDCSGWKRDAGWGGIDVEADKLERLRKYATRSVPSNTTIIDARANTTRYHDI